MTLIANNYKNCVQFFFLDYCKKIAPKAIQSGKTKDCELIIKILPSNLNLTVDLLKNKINIQFDQLIDIAVVDQPQELFRFKTVYLLLSIRFNCRLYLITRCQESKSLFSLSNFFKSAGWLEREV